MVRLLTMILITATILFGCQSEKKQTNTPQSVLVEWQRLVDSGDYQTANALSSSSTKAWLQSIEEIADPNDVAEITILEDIKCEENGDTATCFYYITEDGERLELSTRLILVNGHWVVHILEEE